MLMAYSRQIKHSEMQCMQTVERYGLHHSEEPHQSSPSSLKKYMVSS